MPNARRTTALDNPQRMLVSHFYTNTQRICLGKLVKLGIIVCDRRRICGKGETTIHILWILTHSYRQADAIDFNRNDFSMNL